ncbi:hypothetical protein ACLOJK_036022 [Asimina triloba]
MGSIIAPQQCPGCRMHHPWRTSTGDAPSGREGPHMTKFCVGPGKDRYWLLTYLEGLNPHKQEVEVKSALQLYNLYLALVQCHSSLRVRPITMDMPSKRKLSWHGGQCTKPLGSCTRLGAVRKGLVLQQFSRNGVGTDAVVAQIEQGPGSNAGFLPE